MITKNGLCTFECDKNVNGTEKLNYSQRNNKFNLTDYYPKAQYNVTWKNMCNVTAMCMALDYAGYVFPSGKYEQPEDNLAHFICTNETIDQLYSKEMPAMFKAWKKSLLGQCTTEELQNVYPPNELHDYLAKGTNLWLGTDAISFSTNTNFLQALFKNLVVGNNPMVVSTNFGGFGHIVTVTGVTYSEAAIAEAIDTYEADKRVANINSTKYFLPEPIPTSLLVDDPWGKLNTKNNKYDAPNGGNDIVIPWDFAVKHFKALNSPKIKWCHQIAQSAARI